MLSSPFLWEEPVLSVFERDLKNAPKVEIKHMTSQSKDGQNIPLCQYDLLPFEAATICVIAVEGKAGEDPWGDAKGPQSEAARTGQAGEHRETGKCEQAK